MLWQPVVFNKTLLNIIELKKSIDFPCTEDLLCGKGNENYWEIDEIIRERPQPVASKTLPRRLLLTVTKKAVVLKTLDLQDCGFKSEIENYVCSILLRRWKPWNGDIVFI